MTAIVSLCSHACNQASLEAEVNLRTAFDVTAALADLLARERKAFVARCDAMDQQLAALGAVCDSHLGLQPSTSDFAAEFSRVRAALAI